MKEKGFTNRIKIAVPGICLSIIFLMGFFFVFTVIFIRKNMELQTQAAAETIMDTVESELNSLEETAYLLAGDRDVKNLVGAFGVDFFDLGAEAAEKMDSVLGRLTSIDNVVAFNSSGQFYRLKGTAPNTVLNRVFYLAGNNDARTLNIPSGKEGYIGLSEKVVKNGEASGYVVILAEQSLIRRMLGAYDELDYLGACLYSGDEMICSNRTESKEKIEESIGKALFVKEKAIGISGFKLLVFCDNTLVRNVVAYFSVAMPLIISLLIVLFIAFMMFMRRHMFTAYELDMQSTHLSLLKKQISAHFTVNTLNVIRALVNKGEKESAASTCDELSKLLRYANGGDEYISLLEEFNVLSQYVLIMQTRYPGRIEADLEEEDFFSEVYIPRMLLQPIVENAIVHGISSGKGTICLNARLEKDDLFITVSDNGRGMGSRTLADLLESINSADSDYKKLESVALRNIQRRIRILCGDDYGLSVTSELGKGTEVVVHLPVRK